MKEYIAEQGGRYTYSDDILNLQELALSMTSIFSACSNFIISGCETDGSIVNSGFVWLNGKVRYFKGSNAVTFPYYLYEVNQHESVTYANDENKKGRCNYLCFGGQAVPQEPDKVTNMVPQFIQVQNDYAPRFIDKFIGQYAVLLDTPFSKQTIKKELVVAGNFTGEKNIESKTAVSVVNESKGYTLKNIVKATGDASVGLYKSGLLVNEIIIGTNGTFSLYKSNQLIATFNAEGVAVKTLKATNANIGHYLIENSIENYIDESDSGSVIINYSGTNKKGEYYRDLLVYDGKCSNTPIFKVEGKSKIVRVDGYFRAYGNGSTISLANNNYPCTNKSLLSSIQWLDKDNKSFARVGFISSSNSDFTVTNTIGNVILSSQGYIDLRGEVWINGNNIFKLFVTQSDHEIALDKKVNKERGKQLSTEDFTTELLEKLEEIRTGNIEDDSEGYVLAEDVLFHLNKKLSQNSNLSDLSDKGVARINLGVFSKEESNNVFLKVSGNLLELVNLSAEEINGLTTEQAQQLRAKKQEAVRDNLDAEKKGVADFRLAKSANLSDIPDKAIARKNISVYSIADIDKKLESYLKTDAEYKGVVFTTEHRAKLEAIGTGNFSFTDENENNTVMKDGYALISDIITQLDKKANILLDNYTDDQRKVIYANLKIYSKDEADTKFASLESLFQDYITFLVKTGKTTAQAQSILREKLNVLSKDEITNGFIRKDSKLSDLVLNNADAKKLACRNIGAAYAEEYQTKLKDTGWLQMTNSGSTDTRRLYIRQIGNIVCIQGIINTGRRNGSHWGGTVAYIPNQIESPKYGVQTSAQIFNDDAKYNRGTTFVLRGNSREIVLYESGHNNVDTELNFTYMT